MKPGCADIRKTFAGLLAFVFAWVAVPASASQIDRIGYAFDRDTGVLLYTETHARGPDGVWRVAYEDSNGVLIAEKELHFSGSDIRPDFILTDLRTGYVEGSEAAEGRFRLFTRQDSSSKLETHMLRAREDRPLVIDAGFDRFVLASWSRLMEGEAVAFEFAAPFRLKSYGLRIRRDPAAHVENPDHVVLKLEIDNFLIRLFVDAVELTYERETRRLLAYEGATNINDPEGKSYVARILFPGSRSQSDAHEQAQAQPGRSVARNGSGLDDARALVRIDAWKGR